MYPVAFEADFVEERSRLSTFFRLILLIPWLLVAILWSLGAFVATVCAWFAIVVTGRYPQGLYDFNVKAMRYFTRVTAFQQLMTDAYPPFDGHEHDEYPVRLRVAPALERYSRAKAFFRLILLIPIFVVLYLVAIVSRAIVLLSWVTIVVLGRQPRGLFDIVRWCATYEARAMAYHSLVTESYPPLSIDDADAGAPTTGTATTATGS